MSRQRTGIRNIRRSRLSAGLILLFVFPLGGVTPRHGDADPEFTKLPFSEWAARGKQAGLRWTVDFPQPSLSTHQRMIARIMATVDGKELAKRSGKGEFIFLVQLEDSTGARWQNHASLKLADVQKGVAASDVQFIEFAFIMPGDYTVSMAVCDSATLEYSFATRRMHVGPLKDDPLPEAWTGLPAVEFIQGDSGPPDIWFLPEIQSHLNLAVDVRKPVDVELLVNTTSSERAAASVTVMRRNMSLLVPALKLLAGMKLEKGSVSAALLDLTHQRVAWEQRNIHTLDWIGMRRFLADEQPGKIDVRALESQPRMRRFFFDEISRRMRAPGENPRVIVVLSGPAFLGEQEPVEASSFSARADRDLIYIRDRASIGPSGPPQLRPGRPVQLGPRPAQFPMPMDDLEQALEPLNPHVYDSASSEQFRRILATVLQQIAAM